MMKKIFPILILFLFQLSEKKTYATNPIKAKWIWGQRDDYNTYNDFIITYKRIELPAVSRAFMRITADTRYRLFINDEWISDGPARGWPHSYPYDSLDVTYYLKKGENEIRVVANYFGTGTMHQVCQEAGLLAQLDVVAEDGKRITISTDESWEVSDLPARRRFVPEKCLQMGPYEIYDARLEDQVEFSRAIVRYTADKSPWEGLRERGVALLSRRAFALKNFAGANLVEDDWKAYGFRVTELMYPGLIDANNSVSMLHAMATVVECEEAGIYPMTVFGYGTYEFFVDGHKMERDWPKPVKVTFKKGKNFLLCIPAHPFSHWNRVMSICFLRTEGLRLSNPVDGNRHNTWSFGIIPGARYKSQDYLFRRMPASEREVIRDKIETKAEMLRTEIHDVKSFQRILGNGIRTLDTNTEIFNDPDFQYQMRRVSGTANHLVTNPVNLLSNNSEITIVKPPKNDDIELIYDLGEQNCGYYTFDLIAEDGLVVDVAQVEYISPEGKLQLTDAYRNSMRYICSEGRNQFTSLWRRSGRYVIITLRNQSKPVHFRNFHLIESTYPVHAAGNFRCGDESLSQLWDMSARTVKLCMEDTYTDCPLYEQVLWVGDSRQEALFGMTAFGAHDIARNSILLAAQSLEYYPYVQSQVPSTWGLLMPNYSYLWGIMLWEYYSYTGDTAFIRGMFPYVLKNLRGNNHNDYEAVGAYDAAIQCAEVLGEQKSLRQLTKSRNNIADTLNKRWNDSLGGYQVRRVKGEPEIDLIATFKSVLFDVPGKNIKEKAIETLTTNKEKIRDRLQPVNTMMFLEALEKAGLHEEIIPVIRNKYAPMLRDNTTTVWEHFPGVFEDEEEWDSRSRVHGWSAIPLYFLNRIILGIQPDKPGGKKYIVSPRPNGLTWAEGSTGTVHGSVRVRWEIAGDRLYIHASAPPGVQLTFQTNESLEEFKVNFNYN